jgi:hypothetical protein
VLFVAYMRWTWSLCDGFVVFMIYMIYDAYECICVICDIYLFVLMAKQLNKQKKLTIEAVRCTRQRACLPCAVA